MIFINYRKSDTRFVAIALAESLRQRFGPNQVFLDELTIDDGAVWPQVLRRALDRSTLVLALVGPGWLRACDPYGRRRLDDRKDWVRRELLRAREAGKPILVRLVGDDAPPMHEAAPGLPKKLRWLADVQCKPLRTATWSYDVDALMREMKEHGFADARIVPPLPSVPDREKARAKRLPVDDILDRLDALPGWSLVETTFPRRQELRRMYGFGSFRAAVDFMQFAAGRVAETCHHPRWENCFQSVTVHFSTWDAGSFVTEHDFDAARGMDELFAEFES